MFDQVRNRLAIPTAQQPAPMLSAPGTRLVRISSTTGCRFRFDTDPTAVSTDPYLKGGEPEYFVVNPGEKVSAIRVSTSGSLTVTECS